MLLWYSTSGWTKHIREYVKLMFFSQVISSLLLLPKIQHCVMAAGAGSSLPTGDAKPNSSLNTTVIKVQNALLYTICVVLSHSCTCSNVIPISATTSFETCAFYKSVWQIFLS